MIWLFIENVYLISTLTSRYRKDERLCATFSVQINSLPGAIIEDKFKFCNLELFNPVAAVE